MKSTFTLDKEEQELLESIENDEWVRVENASEEKSLAKLAAGNYLRKDSRVNIRISSNDLSHLKQEAARKGLPYQTFISSVLHQYASGHFTEIKMNSMRS